jgi:hypothetical protein
MSERFEKAKRKISEIVARSTTPEDPVHSEKTLEWLLKLRPDADEILQLAALGHDVERARPDRLIESQFKIYDEFKAAHAKKGGEIIAQILQGFGYSNADVARAQKLVTEHEFSSSDQDVQVLSDADSISYFDYNIHFFVKRHTAEEIRDKIRFMYQRASLRARKEIKGIVEGNLALVKYFKHLP